MIHMQRFANIASRVLRSPCFPTTTTTSTRNSSQLLFKTHAAKQQLHTMTFKPIKLYTAKTPNGYKASVFLEELKQKYGPTTGFDYETQTLSFAKNEQKEDWFLKICPNGRIPAIVDPNVGGEAGFNVFETAAILLYLQEQYDTENVFGISSNDKDAKLAKSEIVQWMAFVHGGVGPMQGQANHFNHYAPEDIPYGKNRYTNETKRLYSVLETRLQGRDWLAGNGPKGSYTIADINAYPWVNLGEYSGLDQDDIGPNVRAWIQRNYDRQAVKKGVSVPEPNEHWEEMMKPGFGKRFAAQIKEKSKENAKWIQEGNKKL